MTDKRIEAVARSIWQRQKDNLRNPSDIAQRRTWRDKDTPDIFWNGYADDAQAAITAYEKALEDEGYVVVPREPTEAMRLAGETKCRFVDRAQPDGTFWSPKRRATEAYQAMISAAGKEKG